MRFGLIIILAFLVACSTDDVPDGKILIRNDIQDKKYNSFVIDQVITDKGAAGIRVKLNPRQKYLIDKTGVRTLRFTRKYEGHEKVYVVSCPEIKSGIVMKLIDVHTNRIDGDCKLRKRGKKVRGVVDWEK